MDPMPAPDPLGGIDVTLGTLDFRPLAEHAEIYSLLHSVLTTVLAAATVAAPNPARRDS